MSDIRLTRRQTRSLFGIRAGATTVFQFRPFQVQVLEVQDTHFHHDSAVLVPQFDPEVGQTADNPTGLEVLRACLLHAKAKPNEKLLISGHTDTTGDKGYNVKLSGKRCKSVQHALLGERAEWVAVAMDKHKTEDHQAILKWLYLFWDWDTDPGDIDNTPGPATDKALKHFKETYNAVMGGSLPVNAAVDAATWGAFFDMYMETVADSLDTEPDGLKEWRGHLKFLDPGKKWAGCGEYFPIEDEFADNYDSETNRRVELLFFAPEDEPKLLCHPSSDVCVPDECEIHRKQIFKKLPIPPAPLPLLPVTTKITEIKGLYKPGHNDPADVAADTNRSAGYKAGYKSEDNKGRIYLNHIPRADASVDWQTLWKKDTQYIELTAELQPAGKKYPRYAEIIWEWSDPDDPSNAGMRDDAAAEVDTNDFNAGTPQGATEGDNLGKCDFPKKDAGFEPQWEAIAPYTLRAVPGTKTCRTLVKDGVSKVRFHATNVGGDNFKIKAVVWQLMRLIDKGADETGIMTMWKRIDVEYRKMPSALDIPVEKVPPFFAPAFVQMDFTKPLPVDDKEFMAETRDGLDPVTSKLVTAPGNGVFANEKKPGWFVLIAARQATKDVGTAFPVRLYRGPGEVKPITYSDGTKGEVVVVPAVLSEKPAEINFIEAAGMASFNAWRFDVNSPQKGQTTVHLNSIDYQSDFVPNDGLVGEAGKGGSYDHTDDYYAQSIVTEPGHSRHGTGFGFTNPVQVSMFSKGGRSTAGQSPETKHAGKDYFAGKTIIFTQHRAYFRPAKAELTVSGGWIAGDTLTLTVDGDAVTVTAAQAMTADQMSEALAQAIAADAAVSAKVRPLLLDALIKLIAAKPGDAGNSIKLKVARTSAGGGVAVSSPTLTGGGANPDEMLTAVVHEFGHAFGFPHKCGYNTFENPAGTSCCMNYTVTWLYAPGTKDVQRFTTGKEGRHFCPRHLMGIRRVSLELNPAMWKW